MTPLTGPSELSRGALLNGPGDKGAENSAPASEAERMQSGPKKWFPEMES